MTCFGFDGTTALVKRTVALVLLAVGAVGAAQGQSRADEAVALYDGPDREQRLIAGAHREGVLTFYTSLHEQNLPLFLAAFERKYGIKVKT